MPTMREFTKRQVSMVNSLRSLLVTTLAWSFGTMCFLLVPAAGKGIGNLDSVRLEFRACWTSGTHLKDSRERGLSPCPVKVSGCVFLHMAPLRRIMLWSTPEGVSIRSFANREAQPFHTTQARHCDC
jgi:hypothetical protein